jgi:hypothetical protein
MKYAFLLLIGLVTLGGCTTEEDKGLKEVDPSDINTDDPAILSFEEKEYEFGKIVAGEKVEYDFKFTNTGGSRLIIVDAKGDCGCTVPEWPKEPIEPGESGVIHVSFNSAHKPNGPIKREIRVRANTHPETITKVYMVGEIVGPGNE